MRAFDFAPLSRSSIGFDRVFDLINNNLLGDTQAEYPPYNIERIGEETYRITLALAGFAPDDITVTAQQNLLRIAGEKSEPPNAEYLHQGIAGRQFERRFSLEDHIEVQSASFENGLLEVNLVRNIPEAMKPRRIAIDNGRSRRNRTVEHLKAAS